MEDCIRDGRASDRVLIKELLRDARVTYQDLGLFRALARQHGR